MAGVMNFHSNYSHLGACALFALAAFAASSPAIADESPFSHVYLTEVLPKGAMEIEQWASWGWKKPDEQFRQFKGRTEFEYGVTGNFQLAGYLNYGGKKIVPMGPNAPDGPANEFDFESVSLEGIYQVLNPFIDPFGLALYVEPAIGNGERELEFKVLLQKNFLDDRLIVAGNIILEYEWEREPGHWEHESALEFYLGAAYRVAPGWFAGVEFLNENKYEGHILGGAEAETNAFYAGPVLHYGSQNWWATLSVLKQLPWAGNPAGDAGAITNGYLTGAERWRLRTRIGIPL
jgi:hypothetical protein